MKACSIFDRFLVNRKGFKKMTMTKVIATAMIGSNFLLKFSIESKVRWPGSDGLNQMAWITSLNWMSNPSKKCYTINILILDRLTASTNSDVTSRPLSLCQYLVPLSRCALELLTTKKYSELPYTVVEDGAKRKWEEIGGQSSPHFTHTQFLVSPFSRGQVLSAVRSEFISKPLRLSLIVSVVQ